jgi:hypothetical protein
LGAHYRTTRITGNEVDDLTGELVVLAIDDDLLHKGPERAPDYFFIDRRQAGADIVDDLIHTFGRGRAIQCGELQLDLDRIYLLRPLNRLITMTINAATSRR